MSFVAHVFELEHDPPGKQLFGLVICSTSLSQFSAQLRVPKAFRATSGPRQIRLCQHDRNGSAEMVGARMASCVSRGHECPCVPHITCLHPREGPPLLAVLCRRCQSPPSSLGRGSWGDASSASMVAEGRERTVAAKAQQSGALSAWMPTDNGPYHLPFPSTAGLCMAFTNATRGSCMCRRGHLCKARLPCTEGQHVLYGDMSQERLQSTLAGRASYRRWCHSQAAPAPPTASVQSRSSSLGHPSADHSLVLQALAVT